MEHDDTPDFQDFIPVFHVLLYVKFSPKRSQAPFRACTKTKLQITLHKSSFIIQTNIIYNKINPMYIVYKVSALLINVVAVFLAGFPICLMDSV